uniref:Sas10 C-terminal domain-containing protein n=1 Tax=Clastoptera arizonana TaxID=38151 RepID=A0A1B6CGF7_9HEMI
MNKAGRNNKAAVDLEFDDYEPTDSDDDYDENEKHLLEQASKGKSRFNENEDDSEEEVFPIHSSNDEDDDSEEDNQLDPVGKDMDSDIEGKIEEEDNLPNTKAWGSKRKNFYNTDYIDQDYGGFSKAEEEEAALMEEKEARAIQNRLTAELDESDFSFGLLSMAKNADVKKDKKITADVDEVIKTDLSKLSKREKLILLEQESPEFLGIIKDFKECMTYAQEKLEPIVSMIDSQEIPNCAASRFTKVFYQLTLNYCTNIAFYLLLKARHQNVQSHPVVASLIQLKKRLDQMHNYGEDFKLQIEEILRKKNEGECVEFDQDETSKRFQKKKKLKILTSIETKPEVSGKKLKLSMNKEVLPDIEELRNEDDDSEDLVEKDSEDLLQTDFETKRGITFQIAKNKGLTPHRKKEMRNPRVRNRNKFKKAKIRRKGQVREVHKETSRYGGEMFGIKATVVKSIKLK